MAREPWEQSRAAGARDRRARRHAGARAAATGRRRAQGRVGGEPANALHLHERRQLRDGIRGSDNGPAGQTGRPAEEPAEGRPRELPAASALRRLRRRRLERLDRRAARIRRLLLSRWLPVSSRGSSELDESRDRADPRLLDQAEHGAEGVLRADRTQLDIDALSGRGE